MEDKERILTMAKMKNRCRFGRVLGVSLLLACASLSGCIMVPYETTPKADLSNVKPVALSEKRNIVFERNVDVLVGAGNRELILKHAISLDDRAMRNAARRNSYVGILEEGTRMSLQAKDISLRIECRNDQNIVGAFFTGLTLMIVPFPCYHSWQYDFTVRDGVGRAAQYHFEDGWREHVCSPILFFFMPFYDTSYETVSDRVLGNVYDQLFLSMQRDGFFDPPPKQAVLAPSGSNAVSSDRLKELESLKAAGVISEDEYRREVERLGKTGGK